MNEQLANALGKLTAGMDEASLKHLELVLCVFELKDGEQLIAAGKHSASMFIVFSGTLSVRVGEGKKSVSLPDLQVGDWVGEIAMLDPGPASATVLAKGAATVLEFPHKTLLDFAKEYPNGALHLLSKLATDLAVRLQRTSDGLVHLGQSGLELADPKKPEKSGMVESLLKILNHFGGRE